MESTTSENPWVKMALNNAWANATLYAALGGLSGEAFTAQRPGFFPSLAGTMNHVYQVDLYYLDALEEGGSARRPTTASPKPTRGRWARCNRKPTGASRPSAAISRPRHWRVR